MSRVAIVFPYFRTSVPTAMLFPPLGAAFLASQLRNLNIETKIFDCTFTTFRQLQRDLSTYRPDIVGIYSMVSLSRNTFRIAEMVRGHLPHCLIVAGGPLPTLYPERFSGHFDAVFRGESDLSFPRFCRDLTAHDLLVDKTARHRLDDLPLDSYAGLFMQNHAGEANNPTIHYTEQEINAFPLPDRSDFDHSAYQKAWLDKTGSATTSIMTTLGCPFNCDFCSRPIFGNLFRRRDLELVFTEIDQIRRLGYKRLWIADDNFTLDLSYLRDFCRRMAGQHMNWSCLSRVTGITTEIAREMKEAGCQRVYLGLETGDQDTLKLMNKKASMEEGISAVHAFCKAGIEVAAFFIVGYPGETITSIEKTFKLALSLPLDDISFNVPYPLPGSRLFERVSGLVEGDWNKENEVTFLFSSEFDPRWLKRRIGQTMKTFAEKHQ
jgi:anaerobic magnesium-protoporphyrin IX monomethyl ester cyclase